MQLIKITYPIKYSIILYKCSVQINIQKTYQFKPPQVFVSNSLFKKTNYLIVFFLYLSLTAYFSE